MGKVTPTSRCWPHQGDDVPFASFLNSVPK
jgi:hypothetical protein